MQKMCEQLLIDIHESCIFPDGFNSLREYAAYVQQQASRSRTGVHTQRLSDAVVIEYIDVLPSLILTRLDGQGWQRGAVEQYGIAFFGGRGFQEIQLQTADGYELTRGMIEITPNFHNLKNFRVVE